MMVVIRNKFIYLMIKVIKKFSNDISSSRIDLRIIDIDTD